MAGSWTRTCCCTYSDSFESTVMNRIVNILVLFIQNMLHAIHIVSNKFHYFELGQTSF